MVLSEDEWVCLRRGMQQDIDEARAIARRFAAVVREAFEYADGKQVAGPDTERRVGHEFTAVLAAFDALPWAKEA